MSNEIIVGPYELFHENKKPSKITLCIDDHYNISTRKYVDNKVNAT